MRRVLLISIGLLLIAGVMYFATRSAPEPEKPAVIAAPTTKPATAPTTVAVKPPPKPKDYMDVVRLRFPDFPTTQPQMVPLAMPDAAKLIIDDPIYLDSMGEIWITRPDAEATTTVFKTVNDQSTHVVRENIMYVHRWPDTTGIWWPQLICKKPTGGYELVTRTSRQDLTGAYNYDWSRAFEWNDTIVVPTDRGISLIRPDRRPIEMYHEFIPADQYQEGKFSPPLALLDWRGLVAWMPWEEGKRGSHGAARFLNEKWSVLDSTTLGWPDKILHLVPLLDGSVLQLALDEQNNVNVGLAVVDAANVDEKKIVDLVTQLSDDEPEKRTAAFSELTRYGSGIRPILEKQRVTLSPAAQIKIEQLLAANTEPALGGMKLLTQPLKVVSRGMFGSVVLYADAGIEMPRDAAADPPRFVNPAWISIQPGMPIQLLPEPMTEELKPPGTALRIVRGEFFINDELQGPRWWLSNHFSPPLLKESERQFKQLVGQDGRTRWLFRRNLTDSSPTLIIDPMLPDPTPRLPVWVYKVEGSNVGWNADNWPAIKKGGTWALIKNDWYAMDENKDKFYTRSDPPPPSTAPTTTATTGPTSLPGLGEPILVDDDGTRYYDGRKTLHMITSKGTDITWDLPPEAVGSDAFDPLLFRAGDNRLFLFNSVSRVLRIRPTPDRPQPFKLEAAFTKRIPAMDNLDRIWLDPAGRIIIAYDGNTFAVLFPNGRIPPELAQKLTASDLSDAEE